MRVDDIRNIYDGFAYFTDCQLATVSHMALQVNRPSGEYRRHIKIAQNFVDWGMKWGVNFATTRVEEMEKHGFSVAQWAQTFEVPKKAKKSKKAE